jgi:hypothetical protein
LEYKEEGLFQEVDQVAQHDDEWVEDYQSEDDQEAAYP